MNDKDSDSAPLTADVGAQRVARVYAEALLNNAEKRGQVEALFEELDSLVHDVFRSDPLVEQFFASPAVPTKVKAEAIERLFGGRGSELFINFLKVLNDHGRLDLLPQILRALRDLHERRQRRVRVYVRSAVPLADDQRGMLEDTVRRTLHLEPILVTTVDPDLIGGMTVRVWDFLYDASVSTQLATIRDYLIARCSHEIQSGRDRFSLAE
jgi:F-type H+-transporting ATPase subunit delta